MLLRIKCVLITVYFRITDTIKVQFKHSSSLISMIAQYQKQNSTF